MCNESDQQVRQLTQLAAQGSVDPLSAGVGRNLADRRVSSLWKVFARWRSREKKSLSWQITPSMF